MSGLASLYGRAQGTPQLAATVVADKAVGLMLTSAVMAAIIHRMKTGQGQFIEVPMFESMVAFVLPEHLGGLAYDPPHGTSGYNRLINLMRRPYATEDGFLCVLPYTTQQWHRFFHLIGRSDLAADADLADPVKRNARLQELYGLIAEVMPGRTTRAWVADLLAADILFGEVLSPEELLHDPHLAAVGMFTEADHLTEGRIRLLGFPIQSSAGASKLRQLPPHLGEHSREILCELGLDGSEIDEMVRTGQVVAQGRSEGLLSPSPDSPLPAPG